jgi:hypothetical protein
MIVGDRSGVKERQASKIQELAQILKHEGFVSLDEQAVALGISRSTTWTILRGKHKNYGLSVTLINRVLRKPDLNGRVRAKFVEYVHEKMAGAYGHNNTQLRRFVRHFSGPGAATPNAKVKSSLKNR